MTYKSILAHVETGANGEARLRCAVDLADRFGARLTGCASEMVPLVRGPLSPGADGEIDIPMTDTVDRDLAEARAMFERVAPQNSGHWISARNLPDEALALAAKCADIIVTGPASENGFDAMRREDPGLLVVISGRPVLIAPRGRDYLKADRVLVCWKDTREANRAISDALPLLERADEVLVVEVADPSELVAAHQRVTEVAEFMRWHGVRATGEGLLRDGRPASKILQDRARWFSADLLVAGGYGRSRLGEWAFGGVTKAFLEQTEWFVLLSH